MSFDSPSPPPAPDPGATASAQAGYNTQAAVTQAGLNRINQVTPFGNLTYTSDSNSPEYQAKVADFNARKQALENRMNAQYGVSGWDVGKAFSSLGADPAQIPQYTQTTTLTPQAQDVLNTQLEQDKQLASTSNNALRAVQATQNTPFNYSGIAPMVSSADLMKDRANVTQDIYGRLTPELDRQKEQLHSQLINQGLTQGSTAYNNAMDQFGRQSNDAYQQADIAGGQEQSRLFGLGQAQRQQGISEYAQQREQPLNELNALRSASQVQTPTFSAVPQVSVGAPNYQAAVGQQYQGNLDAYNAQQASSNSMMSGLFGLGGALGGAGIMKYSDRRLKSRIRRIGQYRNGLPKYEFQYVWGWGKQIGAMADEVRKRMPHAVVRLASGYDAVRYDLVEA